MEKQISRTKREKKARIPILGVILVILFIYCIYIFAKQQPLIDEKKQKIEELRMLLAEETKNNTELKKIREMVGTDEYIEKIAREELGLLKPGERVFIDMND